MTLTLDPAINNSVSIDFNQGGIATPLFRIQQNSTGDRLRFYNNGNLMLDMAGSIIIYTNVSHLGNVDIPKTNTVGTLFATNFTLPTNTVVIISTNAPPLPATNTVTIGAYNLAGFSIPDWITSSSNLFFPEPSMYMHNSHWVCAGQAAPTTLNVGNIQSSGSVFQSGSLGSLNAELFGYHNGYFTTGTSNDSASLNPQIICAAGTRKGHGGYLLGIRFGVTNGVIEKGGGGIGLFTGVLVGGGSISSTMATTNAAVERMGVQVYGQMGTSNFIWTSRDTAGTEFRRDTTLSLYPSNTYVFHMYCPPLGRTVGWRLENLDRGEYTNSFETDSISTNVNLPVIGICNKTNRSHAFFFNWIHATTALGF